MANDIASLPEFGDFPEDCRDFGHARVVILPVPYDATSTWGRGADKGPLALLSASGAMEKYDMETGCEPCRAGIHTVAPLAAAASPEAMVKAIRDRTTSLLGAGKFVVAIGGNHTISIGAIDAHRRRYPNLSVLQLDAHADLRPDYRGSPLNHACVMARAAEWSPITQVGIRSMDASELGRAESGRMFPAEAIQGDPDVWGASVIATLREDVYITIDLDVFDPSIMPSTGTPEPGGLLWYPVLRLLRRVVEERNVVGFDVVELCPSEHDRAPDYAAAKLVYKLLAYRFRSAIA